MPESLPEYDTFDEFIADNLGLYRAFWHDDGDRADEAREEEGKQ